jgi:hypothetical protein
MIPIYAWPDTYGERDLGIKRQLPRLSCLRMMAATKKEENKRRPILLFSDWFDYEMALLEVMIEGETRGRRP